MTASSTKVRHPKCGKIFNNSESEGHCAACCLTFIGLKAFDMHRIGGKCTPPIDGDKLFWLDDQDRWHYSQRMSPEQRARLRNARTSESSAPPQSGSSTQGAGTSATDGAIH